MAEATISERFLHQVFIGNMDAALQLVEPDAAFVATRRSPNPDNPLHGTYRGHDRIRSFFRSFLELIEPGAFTITGRCRNADTEVIYGQLSHTVRNTALPFDSEWAMVAATRGSRIRNWQFYEDSEALARAMASDKRPGP